MEHSFNHVLYAIGQANHQGPDSKGELLEPTFVWRKVIKLFVAIFNQSVLCLVELL